VIQTPRRAVTRFFVPLIDVLILLFCMFLLLPIVSNPDAKKAGTEPDTGLPADVAELQQRLLLAEAQVKALLTERPKLAERTVVPVLQVDGKDGRLFYYDKSGPMPVRVDVEKAADAHLYIDRQKQVANGQPVHFLILMPRELSGFPTGPQRKMYREWFAGRQVPFTVDDPWAAK
jgi:hypothetical protein